MKFKKNPEIALLEYLEKMEERIMKACEEKMDKMLGDKMMEKIDDELNDK